MTFHKSSSTSSALWKMLAESLLRSLRKPSATMPKLSPTK